jgi:hypothetical protein
MRPPSSSGRMGPPGRQSYSGRPEDMAESPTSASYGQPGGGSAPTCSNVTPCPRRAAKADHGCSSTHTCTPRTHSQQHRANAPAPPTPPLSAGSPGSPGQAPLFYIPRRSSQQPGMPMPESPMSPPIPGGRPPSYNGHFNHPMGPGPFLGHHNAGADPGMFVLDSSERFQGGGAFPDVPLRPLTLDSTGPMGLGANGAPRVSAIAAPGSPSDAMSLPACSNLWGIPKWLRASVMHCRRRW